MASPLRRSASSRRSRRNRAENVVQSDGIQQRISQLIYYLGGTLENGSNAGSSEATATSPSRSGFSLQRAHSTSRRRNYPGGVVGSPSNAAASSQHVKRSVSLQKKASDRRQEHHELLKRSHSVEPKIRAQVRQQRTGTTLSAVTFAPSPSASPSLLRHPQQSHLHPDQLQQRPRSAAAAAEEEGVGFLCAVNNKDVYESDVIEAVSLAQTPKQQHVTDESFDVPSNGYFAGDLSVIAEADNSNSMLFDAQLDLTAEASGSADNIKDEGDDESVMEIPKEPIDSNSNFVQTSSPVDSREPRPSVDESYVSYEATEESDSEGDSDLKEKDYSSLVRFCHPPPIFLLLISALEIGMYFTQDEDTDFSDSQLVYNPCKRQQAWPRYLMYVFTHQDSAHLAGNIVAQICMGSMMELVHTWRIPVIYLSSAVGGCLMHSMISGDKVVYGASGGVFGLIGARIADLVLNMNDMMCLCATENAGDARQVFKRVMFGKVGQGMIAIACSSYAIYDFIHAIVSQASGDEDTTSYGTHLGGLIVGTLVGILALKNIRDERWEKTLKIVIWCILVAYVVFSVAWNVFSPRFPDTNSTLCHKYLYTDEHHYPLLESRPNLTHINASNGPFPTTMTLTIILGAIRTTTAPSVARSETEAPKTSIPSVFFQSESAFVFTTGSTSKTGETTSSHQSTSVASIIRSAVTPSSVTVQTRSISPTMSILRRASVTTNSMQGRLNSTGKPRTAVPVRTP